MLLFWGFWELWVNKIVFMFLFVILVSYLNCCWLNFLGVIEVEYVVEDVEVFFECGNEVEYL